jgi:hypothetical protein
MPPPFYLDWTFWSFVAAAVAVVLSQLPPVRQWRTRARIEVDVYGRLVVDHLLGFPNLAAVIGIRNTGGRSARVHAVNAVLRRNGQVLSTVRGATYYMTPESKDGVIFTPYQSGPGHEWVHTIHFVERLAQNEDRDLGQLRADVRLDISNKLREREANDPGNPNMVEASDALVQRMSAVFNQRFVWVPGEYEVEIQVMADDALAATRRYRFTLYESDVRQLRDEFDRYRFGFVVALDDPNKRLVFVDVAQVIG